jgi:exoribonuclease R
MAEAPTMVFLGFGKYVRADKIYALEPLRGKDRGGGQRTRVFVEGIGEPIIASRTERSILTEMGVRDAGRVKILDEAIALAERVVQDADKGRVDLADLGRRARRVLESTAKPGDDEQLF